MTTEYVQRFGYRKYTGPLESRSTRITSLAWFELTSTWRKSTLGKVILVIIVAIDFLSILIVGVGSSALLSLLPPDQRSAAIHASLYRLVADYIPIISSGVIPAEGSSAGFSFSINLGFLVVILLAIAGSGLFADDKQGRTLEIYLSKLQRSEYIFGKILAIILYINVFVTLPLLILGAIYVQAFGLNQFDYLWYYVGILAFGLIVSVLFGLALSIFSSLVEKRSYASLGFILLFFLGSIFQYILVTLNPDNPFYLLLPFSSFFVVLAYTVLGMYNLEIITGTTITTGPTGSTPTVTNSMVLLNLNNGVGLEWYHVYLMVLVLVIIMFLFLVYKIRKLTTEDL